MTYSLISDDNQAFIAGKSNVLARQNEIFANLQRKTGILPFPKTAKRQLFQLILMVLTGGLGIGLSLVLIVATGIWFLFGIADWPFFLTEDGATSCGFTAAFIFLVFFFLAMGIIYFPDVYARMSYPIKLTDIFDALKEQRQMFEGSILDIQIEGKTRVITYRFELPDGGQPIVGEYITMVGKPFQEKDKVMVLYLNHDIHTLI